MNLLGGPGPESFDTTAVPSGTDCVECDATDGWWFHLRRCAQCGHIGCCDDSLSQHAQAHWRETGHRVIQSFEPGEAWLWDYQTQQYVNGPDLEAPHAHPDDQPVPGPAGRVPEGWRQLLAERR